MIGKLNDGFRGALGTLRADGPVALCAQVWLQDRQDYVAWLEERDLVSVIAALGRLNDRQLARLGMSRTTLALDVEDLFARAAAEQRVAADVIELVNEAPKQMMAAE